MSVGDYPVEFAHSVFAVTTGSLEVVAVNKRRVFLLLVNDSDEDIYVSFDVVAALNTGIRLNANGSHLELHSGNRFLDQRAINAIHGGTGTKNLLITEG